jgi:hypothetical protein
MIGFVQWIEPWNGDDAIARQTDILAEGLPSGIREDRLNFRLLIPVRTSAGH